MRLFRKERRQEPAGANLARDLIRRLGGGGDQVALSYVDEIGAIVHLTYADVGRGARQWADVLRENTVVAGERVLVLAGRDVEWRSALLGAVEAGAVAVPCPGSLPAEVILDRARHCGAAVIVSAVPRPDLELEPAAPVIAADELRRKPREADPRPRHKDDTATAARDIALVLQEDRASGVRGVVHTHGSLLAQALAGEHWLGAKPGQRLWCTAAEGSPESIWAMLAAWGARAELLCVSRELETEQRLELLHGLPVDVIWLTPDEYRALAAAEHPSWYDLSRVRRALVEPGLEEETVDALRETFGLGVGAIFGLAETGVLAAADPGKPLRPLPELELAVVDERGDAAPPDEVGDLLLLGSTASLFVGYWNAPRATETALRKNAFRTGHRARIDGSGALHALGRAAPGLELVEDVDEEELLATAVPLLAAPQPEPAAKLSRKERKQQREAEELRQVSERARDERDELDQLRRERDERVVEEQRELEDRRLKEQDKARRKAADRAGDIARREEREAAKAEKQRLREEKRVAAEQRRLAEEQERRERDRRRREEKEAARAAKVTAAAAAVAEKDRREESKRAEREQQEAERREQEERRRAEAEAAELARVEAVRLQREAEGRRRVEEAERLEQERREREELERREREEAERAAAEERRRAETEAAERARLQAEEQARREAEERRRAEEAERLAAEERRRAETEAAERARLQAEEQARRQAEERRRADEAAAARAADERRLAEEQARSEAEVLLREADERRRREVSERDLAAERERAAVRQAAALEAERRRRRLAASRPSEPGEPGGEQEPAEPNAGLLARIGQYGMSAGGPPPVETEPPRPDENADDEDEAAGGEGRSG